MPRSLEIPDNLPGAPASVVSKFLEKVIIELGMSDAIISITPIRGPNMTNRSCLTMFILSERSPVLSEDELRQYHGEMTTALSVSISGLYHVTTAYAQSMLEGTPAYMAVGELVSAIIQDADSLAIQAMQGLHPVKMTTITHPTKPKEPTNGD